MPTARKTAQNAASGHTREDLVRAMEAGAAGYVGDLGDWWALRAADALHAREFRRIVRWLVKQLPQSPARILDYACGTGHLMHHLRRVFPTAHLIGYDGAEPLLTIGRASFADDKRAELRQKWLPDLADPCPPVDLSIVCFPHLLMSDDRSGLRAYRQAHRAEATAARRLWEEMIDAEHWDPEEDDRAFRVGQTLFERMCARHCHRVTRPGGYCLRVGYAYSGLEEIDPVYLAYSRFSEGWDHLCCGVVVDELFRLVASRYVESAVIDDVHAQTGDEEEGGGYTLCLLQRI
ncbi:MAG: methyltransferase domain-containing protein [Planctomycetota bacterium]